MRPRSLLAFASILGCAATLVVAGCSSAPKSSGHKKKRTVLLTEYDDARVGREASRDVSAEIGIIEDASLNAYVSRIGRKLLRGVPRRSFQYQFSVVDQVEPNAFALPGGYIFISRGLLALANNEDELACVIGHEITHAALRHAARQQALAGRESRLAMPWVRAANIASYGRDMEREADKGGQMLAAAAGYDPMGMSTFLRNMGQNERLTPTPDPRSAPPPTRSARASSAGSATRPSATRAPRCCARSTAWRWGRAPKAASSRATVSSIPISTSRCVSPTDGEPRTPTGRWEPCRREATRWSS
jgi:predicted Zn-dependent protease